MNRSSQSHFRLPTSLEPAHEERRLEPVPHPGGVWIDWGPSLPEQYGQDRIALMVRDPWCIFTYWELTGPHSSWLPERHGPGVFASGKWRTRLLCDAEPVAEIVAAHPLGAHYFSVDPDSAWRAEVGMRLPSGQWVTVASSAQVRTPRAWIAPVTDDDWPVSELEMLAQLGFSPEEAARRLELARLSGAQLGYPGSSEAPGPGSSSR